MSGIISWFKNKLEYLKDSLPEIIKGFLLFILVLSGLGCAIYLRYLGYDGYMITFISIIVQVLAMIFSYFLFKKYLISDENMETRQITKKKKR